MSQSATGIPHILTARFELGACQARMGAFGRLAGCSSVAGLCKYSRCQDFTSHVGQAGHGGRSGLAGGRIERSERAEGRA